MKLSEELWRSRQTMELIREFLLDVAIFAWFMFAVVVVDMNTQGCILVLPEF